MNSPPPEAADRSTPEIYWAGPSGYAVLPTAIAWGVVSLGTFFGTSWLGGVLHLEEGWTSVVRFWLVLIPWIGVTLLWAYRAGSFSYRVTATHLHRDYGMAYRPIAPVALVDLTDIRVSQWWWQRLFRFGTVVATPPEGQPLRLRHIHRPERLAAALRGESVATE